MSTTASTPSLTAAAAILLPLPTVLSATSRSARRVLELADELGWTIWAHASPTAEASKAPLTPQEAAEIAAEDASLIYLCPPHWLREGARFLPELLRDRHVDPERVVLDVLAGHLLELG